MFTLVDPHGKIRLEVELQRPRGSLTTAAGHPVVRVFKSRRQALLNLSALLPAAYGSCCSLQLLHGRLLPGGINEMEAELQPDAADGGALNFTFACCNGALLVCNPRDWPFSPRLPRETVVYDLAQPGTGPVTSPAAGVNNAFLAYKKGACAALTLAPGCWLLAVGERPADLLYHQGALQLLDHYRRRLDALFVAARLEKRERLGTVTTPFAPLSLLSEMQSAMPLPTDDHVTAAHTAATAILFRVPEADELVIPLRGEVGSYLMVARKKGCCWHVVALTAEPRVWSIWLPFLDPSVTYAAHWTHDEQPRQPCFQPLPQCFKRDMRPMLQLARGGGFTLELRPLEAALCGGRP